MYTYRCVHIQISILRSFSDWWAKHFLLDGCTLSRYAGEMTCLSWKVRNVSMGGQELGGLKKRVNFIRAVPERPGCFTLLGVWISDQLQRSKVWSLFSRRKIGKIWTIFLVFQIFTSETFKTNHQRWWKHSTCNIHDKEGNKKSHDSNSIFSWCGICSTRFYPQFYWGDFLWLSLSVRGHAQGHR